MWRGFDRKRIKLILLHELAPFSKTPLDRTSDPTVEALSDDYLRRRKGLILSFSVAMGRMRSCWGTVLTYLEASAKSLLAVSTLALP